MKILTTSHRVHFPGEPSTSDRVCCPHADPLQANKWDNQGGITPTKMGESGKMKCTLLIPHLRIQALITTD